MKRILLSLLLALACIFPASAQTQIDLTKQVKGVLPAANGGSSVSSAADDTVLIGNGTLWQAKTLPNCLDSGGQHLNYTASSNSWSCGTSGGGSGTVTSVGFTGGLISVGTPTTTPAFTVAGTSGGIPYFSGASTWASSGALTANLPVIGGGAGAAPAVGSRSGNTTQFVTTTGSLTSGDCVKIDASGNFIANGSACGAGSGTVTSVSVTTANGVSGSVATATTTPAITLTLGAITPTTVNGNTISTGTGTLTLGASKTATISNTLTLTGTDSSSVAFGAGGTVLYNGGAAGTPSSLTCTNCTGTASGLTAGTVTTNANLTGDVTSSGNATTLANTAVTPGSYTLSSITVDSKGRVTAASSGSGGTMTVRTLTDATPVTVTIGSSIAGDLGILTTLSQASTISNPSSGTPTDGQILKLRIKSTTARALTWSSQYRGSVDLALLASTSGSSLTDYLVFQWNAADSKWDYLAKTAGF